MKGSKARADDFARHRIIREIQATLARATGRHYRVDFEGLDTASLRELLRLVRDLVDEMRRVKQQVRREPWRFL